MGSGRAPYWYGCSIVRADKRFIDEKISERFCLLLAAEEMMRGGVTDVFDVITQLLCSKASKELLINRA